MTNEKKTGRLESGAAAARRVRDEFDGYGASILLTELEAAAVSGVSQNTLKFWRLTGSAKGPRPVYLHKMPRYEAGEIRRWRTEMQARPVDDVPVRSGKADEKEGPNV